MGRRKPSRRPTATATATIKDKDNYRKFQPFTVDSTVEVSSARDGDEKGFDRAWYEARILKPLTRQKDKFLVQYQTKTSEKDPNKLLAEIVGVSFIRPIPPPHAANQSYDLHDVVDAFRRDGWWKGVVSKVEVFAEEKQSKSTRYTVVFENPPEKFEFFSGNLRFHHVWDDGKWVRSPKQKRMKGLKIDEGMAVEVNINGEIPQDTWFPAIVRGEVGFNSFLVEYYRSGTDGESRHIEVTIDSFHIRPPPPKFEVQNFEMMERVDAFHDSCWKKGLITATLTQGRYNVTLDSGKEEILFRHLEIRPHQIWKNGKWVGFKETPKGKYCVEQLASVANSTEHSEDVVSVNSLSTALDHSLEKSCCRKMSDAVDDACEKSPVKKLRKNSLDIVKSPVKKLRKNPLDIEEKIGAFGQQNNVSEGIASEMETKDCVSKEAELSTEKDMENGGVMVGTSSISSVTDHTAIVEVPCDAFSDDQALSTCFGRQVGSELTMSVEMPFVKSSSIWHEVDSLEVFQFLPQQPHFSPLFELSELTREGFAIAHMVNFASLVEKTSKLQVKMSREVFDGYLKALADLETFGFDVEPVVERINKLLLIKTRQEQLENKWKDIHSKIAECDSEKAIMEDEIDAIRTMISKLQEQLAVKLSGKAKKDYESNMLRIDARSTSADISIANLDFERQAAAPW